MPVEKVETVASRSNFMTQHDQPLPIATPAMARAIWDQQKRPSARQVATQLTQSGRPVHHSTVSRWRRQGWRPVEPTLHPLDAARLALEAAMPAVTNDPMMRTQDLLGGDAGQKLAPLTDEELLTRAVHNMYVLINLILDETPAILMRTTPAQAAVLLSALAQSLKAAGDAPVPRNVPGPAPRRPSGRRPPGRRHPR
jgi:hypothetical protein